MSAHWSVKYGGKLSESFAASSNDEANAIHRRNKSRLGFSSRRSDVIANSFIFLCSIGTSAAGTRTNRKSIFNFSWQIELLSASEFKNIKPKICNGIFARREIIAEEPRIVQIFTWFECDRMWAKRKNLIFSQTCEISAADLFIWQRFHFLSKNKFFTLTACELLGKL